MTKRAGASETRGPGRPALPPEERRIMVAFRLRPELLAKLDAFAASLGLPRVGMVERLIERARR